MKLKELERQLALARAKGATDETVVLAYESSDRLTPYAGPVTAEQKRMYFTVRDVCFVERAEEFGGGKVIKVYH